MAELDPHWRYLQAEWTAAQAAPLSVRKAMLVAALIDAYADRLFAALGAEDILAFRDGLAQAPAVRLVFELCVQRPHGPHLALEAVAVPIADYGALPVEDFMVSLYNDHSVQRVVVVQPDGSRQLAQGVLASALQALEVAASGTPIAAITV